MLDDIFGQNKLLGFVVKRENKFAMLGVSLKKVLFIKTGSSTTGTFVTLIIMLGCRLQCLCAGGGP